VLIITIARLILNKKQESNDSSNNRNILYLRLSIAAINAGIVLIGRFNQTSAVFMFPLFYLLTAYALESLKPSYKLGVSALLLVILSGFTASNYIEYKDNSYSSYLNEIALTVSPEDETLGNLNSDYHFQNEKLHDYRNLSYLKNCEMSFHEYIRSHNIKYIIYSEELDLIHELQPKWDGIYGPMDYYDEMKAFLEHNCLLQRELTDSFYGIRIVRYMGLKDWKIKIYKVVY
jgi:hypothetical protein